MDGLRGTRLSKRLPLALLYVYNDYMYIITLIHNHNTPLSAWVRMVSSSRRPFYAMMYLRGLCDDASTTQQAVIPWMNPWMSLSFQRWFSKQRSQLNPCCPARCWICPRERASLSVWVRGMEDLFLWRSLLLMLHTRCNFCFDLPVVDGGIAHGKVFTPRASSGVRKVDVAGSSCPPQGRSEYYQGKDARRI